MLFSVKNAPESEYFMTMLSLDLRVFAELDSIQWNIMQPEIQGVF